MSKVIRIDEEMLEFLRRRARPFGDTPNRVIRRLIGLDGDEETPSLTRTERAVLSVLHPEVEITSSEVATAVGVAHGTTNKILADLETRGMVRRRRPSGVYGRAHHQWRRPAPR